ncbi:unnamed protein product [Sphagnum balticum]
MRQKDIARLNMVTVKTSVLQALSASPQQLVMEFGHEDLSQRVFTTEAYDHAAQVSSETHQRGGFIAAAQATMTKGKGQQQLIGVCLPVVMSPQVSHQLISGIDVLECKLSEEFPAADQRVQKCCQLSWTNLLNCWQQPKKIAGGASYCPIPCSALSNLAKKSTFPAPTIVRRRKKRAISGPIYFGDISILSSHRSNRPVSHSVIIAPKMVLHRNSDRNPSPYVALKKSPLQGPLYYS